jgi:predicted membrane protein
MLHFMIFCIVAAIFFALFGAVIVGMIQVFAAIMGVIFLIFVLWLIYSASPFSAILAVTFPICAYIIYKEMKEQKKKSVIKDTTYDTNEFTAQSPQKLKSFLKQSQSTDEFRAKYPFVQVDVSDELRELFIKECLWLESKTGVFPSELEQTEIMKSLNQAK